MAGRTTPLYPGQDTVTFQIGVADYINTLGPWEVPVVKYFGLDGDPKKFHISNWPSTEARWFEDEAAALSTGLTATLSNAVTTFAVTAGTGYLLEVGHILYVDNEAMLVGNVSTDTVTVTRGFAGTTAASHASDSTVYIRSKANVDMCAETLSGVTIPGYSYNYTQILWVPLGISRSELVQARYGIEDILDYEVDKKQKETLRLLDQTFFYGVRTAGSGRTVPRAMGGLKTFITANTANSNGNPLTETGIMNMLQAIWEKGGSPTLMVGNAWAKRKINSFVTGTSSNYRIIVDQPSSVALGAIVDKIQTDFGTVEFLLDRYCPADHLFFLTPDNVGFLAHTPFEVKQLAETADGVNYRIVGEYTLVVQQDKTHGYIYGFSTNS